MKTIRAQDLLSAYNGKYKYVVENKTGDVVLWNIKPYPSATIERWVVESGTTDNYLRLDNIAITEFQDKDWDSCIYEAKPSEEDWIGCVGWFWDENDKDKILDILEAIDINADDTAYVAENAFVYAHFRPATRDEIKFFNDDTSEE